MNPTSGRLYNLLPEIYRSRDVSEGEPLRALLSVIETQFLGIQDDIDSQYANWFVETCDPKFLPYIGELVGVSQGNANTLALIPTFRSLVGNAIRYYRRKGTAATLERVVRDATNWPARVVEYGPLITSTADVRLAKPGTRSLVDFREVSRLVEIDDPFDSLPHSVGVRKASPDTFQAGTAQTPATGRYNLPFLGIFLWRLQSYPLDGIRPRKIQSGCYSFNRFGVDAPLFRPVRSYSESMQTISVDDVPEPITRMALEQALSEVNQISALTELDEPAYPFRIFCETGAGLEPIQIDDLVVSDLSDWNTDPVASESSAPEIRRPAAAVDPILGRLKFLDTGPSAPFLVSFNYGLSGNIGGGPYHRLELLSEDPDHTETVEIDARPRNDVPESKALHIYSLEKGIERAQSQGRRASKIRIPWNETYASVGEPWSIQVFSGASFAIEAGDGVCPALIGDILIQAASKEGGSVTLSGLWIDGSIHIQGNVSLKILHCTIAPPGPVTEPANSRASIVATSGNDVDVTLANSIVGPIRIPQAATLSIADSIVDGGPVQAIAGPDNHFGPICTIQRSTIFGSTVVEEVALASDSIFMGGVQAHRVESGCVRFSYVRPESRTPQRFRCNPPTRTGRDWNHEQPAVRPIFTSETYGDPGYAQLALNCPAEISGGAEDGGEIGAFHFLHQNARREFLHSVVSGFVPIGLEPQIFAVT